MTDGIRAVAWPAPIRSIISVASAGSATQRRRAAQVAVTWPSPRGRHREWTRMCWPYKKEVGDPVALQELADRIGGTRHIETAEPEAEHTAPGATSSAIDGQT